MIMRHGILLQHPVPQQIDERKCFDAINPAKDVDGVTSAGFEQCQWVCLPTVLARLQASCECLNTTKLI